MADRDQRAEPTQADVERRKQEHQRRQAERAEQERLSLQQLHYMHCPKCGAELDEIVFRAVKVDKCFSCGGVFLDDGELEQLVGKPGWIEAMRNFFGG